MPPLNGYGGQIDTEITILPLPPSGSNDFHGRARRGIRGGWLTHLVRHFGSGFEIVSAQIVVGQRLRVHHAIDRASGRAREPLMTEGGPRKRSGCRVRQPQEVAGECPGKRGGEPRGAPSPRQPSGHNFEATTRYSNNVYYGFNFINCGNACIIFLDTRFANNDNYGLGNKLGANYP
jgi:hypothetical protein